MRRILALALLLALAPAVRAEVAQGPRNAPHFAPTFANQTRAPDIGGDVAPVVTFVAGPLAHPWGIAVLPGGGYLVTERPGRLRLVRPDGGMTVIAGTPEVAARNQGGLLDVALAEEFAASRRIFLTYAKPVGPGLAATAAATAILDPDLTRLEAFRDIFVQHPPSPSFLHFGARIVPAAGAVWITLGEHATAAERVLAQDLRTTFGKTVRLTPDGGIPPGNPFAGQKGALAEIWSFGHRNPQGAAVHPGTGDLWTLEHGPKGGDELNRIRPGGNYGWPIVSYGEEYDGTPVGAGRTGAPGIVEPVYYWDPVIAPGGFVFYEGTQFPWTGDVIAASLNPGGIVRLRLAGDTVTGEARYLRELGRVRDVAVDRDGALVVLTDDPAGAVLRVVPGN